MARKAFDGITVLEFAGFIAGPFCSKLLGDMGARVVKVESPGFGDPARHFGPFPDDAPDPEKSGLFLYLNTNKESVTLDITTATGRELFLRLAESADLLVEDRPPGPAEGSMESMGLSYDVLQERNPALVHLSITPFGLTGPKSHWKARHVNTFHASGEGYTLPGGLGYTMNPDRAPVAAGVHLGDYDTGQMAASAAIAALYAREFQGIGQRIEVSSQESTMALNRLTHTLYLGNGRLVDRSRTYEYGGIYACKDGYVILYPREDRQWRVLVEIMGRPELADDERYVTRADRIRHGDEVNRIIGEWAAELTKGEVYYKAAPSGCPAAYFATAEDVLRSPQLADRGFFVDVDHPDTGALTYPSRPYRFPKTPWAVDSPAPLLGQHNGDVYCGLLGMEETELSDLARGGVI